MMHMIGYTLLIYFGDQDVMVVIGAFAISLAVVMTLFESWKYKRARG